jgi:hypothetical protein
MTCCCSDFGGAAERQFTRKKAAQELARYRKDGPAPTARMLQDGMSKAGAVDASSA